MPNWYYRGHKLFRGPALTIKKQSKGLPIEILAEVEETPGLLYEDAATDKERIRVINKLIKNGFIIAKKPEDI